LFAGREGENGLLYSLQKGGGGRETKKQRMREEKELSQYRRKARRVKTENN